MKIPIDVNIIFKDDSRGYYKYGEHNPYIEPFRIYIDIKDSRGFDFQMKSQLPRKTNDVLEYKVSEESLKKLKELGYENK